MLGTFSLAARPSRAAPVTKPANEAPPPVWGPPCASFGSIEVEVPDLDLACADAFCSAPLTLRVRNGGATPIQVERARVRDPAGPGAVMLEWGEAGLLAPRAELVQRVSSHGEGLSEVEVVLRDGPLRVRFVCTVHITNSSMEAARAACKACNGTFGPQGISGRLGCNCRTRDGGKPCWGASECEAGCLASPSHHGSPGQCAASTSRFGCRTWVNDGGSTSRICVD